MKNYEITQGLAQAILNYLVRRPYGDVFELIYGLQNLREIEVKPEAKKQENRS